MPLVRLDKILKILHKVHNFTQRDAISRKARLLLICQVYTDIFIYPFLILWFPFFTPQLVKLTPRNSPPPPLTTTDGIKQGFPYHASALSLPIDLLGVLSKWTLDFLTSRKKLVSTTHPDTQGDKSDESGSNIFQNSSTLQNLSMLPLPSPLDMSGLPPYASSTPLPSSLPVSLLHPLEFDAMHNNNNNTTAVTAVPGSLMGEAGPMAMGGGEHTAVDLISLLLNKGMRFTEMKTVREDWCFASPSS